MWYIIFDIILPTADTYSDVYFAISAFTTEHYFISSIMIIPVILNVFFAFGKWAMTDFDNRKEKNFTWILVLLTLWPQYQTVKMIFRKMPEEDREKQRKKIKNEVACIESFIEGVPQFFCTLCIYAILITRDNKGSNIGTVQSIATLFSGLWSEDGKGNLIQTVFGPTSMWMTNEVMFPISICLSFISSIKSTFEYVWNGPLATNSRSWIVLTATFIYVFLSFYCKSHLFLQTCIITSSYNLKGVVPFLILFGYFVFIPALFGIWPIACYLGLKNMFLMVVKNPPLLTISFITDYYYGPVNGYGNCNCCSRSESQITLHKVSSWIKMIYVMMPYGFAFYTNLENILDPENEDFFRMNIIDIIEYVAYCVSVPLLILVFGITLHAGKSFSVLQLNDPENHITEEIVYECEERSMNMNMMNMSINDVDLNEYEDTMKDDTNEDRTSARSYHVNPESITKINHFYSTTDNKYIFVDPLGVEESFTSSNPSLDSFEMNASAWNTNDDDELRTGNEDVND